MVLPFLMAKLRVPRQNPPISIKCGSDTLSFVILISPLLGLIANMIQVYKVKYNISIMHLEGQDNLPRRIMDEVMRPGSTTRVYIICPESVSSQLCRALYYSSLKEDEKFVRTHCWGVIQDEAQDLALQEDFRSAFTLVIQQPAFSSIRLMLISGTWTPYVVSKVKALLSHRNNFNFDRDLISVDPNRANLYYAIQNTVFKL